MVSVYLLSEVKAMSLLLLSIVLATSALIVPVTRTLLQTIYRFIPLTAPALVAAWISLLKSVAQGPQCSHRADLSGRVVVVTGACSGIGVSTTAQFAKMGADVVMACRDICKAESVKQQLLQCNKGLEHRLHVIQLDLANLASIRDFTKVFREKFNRLDILVNNAGVVPKTFHKTVDGFEMQFGVNHLGHFYLTWNLLDYIELFEGRVINVGSVAANFVKGLDVRMNSDPKLYGAIKAYSNSKLANALFTLELQRRFEERKSRASAYCVHPGMVYTGIGRHGFSTFLRIMDPFACKTTLSGCQTTLHCALAPDLTPGKTYADCQLFTGASSAAQDPQAARELWNLSKALLKL